MYDELKQEIKKIIKEEIKELKKEEEEKLKAKRKIETIFLKEQLIIILKPIFEKMSKGEDLQLLYEIHDILTKVLNEIKEEKIN